MQNRLAEVTEEIQSLKIILFDLWQSQGCQTNLEVLRLSERIDKLINEFNYHYYRAE